VVWRQGYRSRACPCIAAQASPASAESRPFAGPALAKGAVFLYNPAMNSILAWGAGIIASVQAYRSPALDAVMMAITSLGSEYFFLIALPIIFWCVDERRGIRLGFMLFFSLFANLVLKDSIGMPRPYETRPDLRVIDEVGSSMPSWHAQGSAGFWGFLIGWIKGPLGIVLGILFPLLIGFSRVYLGVHYPTDVIAGWAIGAAILILYRFLESRFLPLVKKLHERFQIAIVAAIAWLMCLAHLENVGPGAAFFGIGLGYILNRKHLRFSAKGGLGARALRILPGIVILVGLYLGLKYILPGDESANGKLFRFLRYGLIGFWTSFGAPWIFQVLKLAGRNDEAAVVASGGDAKGDGDEPKGE
jgi:membrane-associated phospholipid phosphatase